MSARLGRLLAALILGAAGGTVFIAVPASAAACAAGKGVTVVVNSSVRCDSNGGGSARSNFIDVGHDLKMASRQPGFVCRVDGYPASDPCVNASPANRYWALFWANGRGGGWTYASSGAGSLSVPTGGWVAFKFQTSSSRSAPGIRPYTAPPAPAPKPKPVTKPKPSAKPSAKASASAKAKTEAKAKAKAEAKAKAKATPSASASASASADDDEITATSATTDSGGSDTMVWVGVGLAAALIAGMAAAVWRRRTAGQP